MLRLPFIFLAVFSLLGFFIKEQKPLLAADFSNPILEINEYRKSKSLAPVAADPFTCYFAQIRAKEISLSFNHDGFYNRVSSKSLPYPRYRLVTENLAWAPGNLNPVKMWINSPSHAANILKNTPFACVGKFNDYYVYEGWG